MKAEAAQNSRVRFGGVPKSLELSPPARCGVTTCPHGVPTSLGTGYLAEIKDDELHYTMVVPMSPLLQTHLLQLPYLSVFADVPMGTWGQWGQHRQRDQQHKKRGDATDCTQKLHRTEVD